MPTTTEFKFSKDITWYQNIFNGSVNFSSEPVVREYQNPIVTRTTVPSTSSDYASIVRRRALKPEQPYSLRITRDSGSQIVGVYQKQTGSGSFYRIDFRTGGATESIGASVSYPDVGSAFDQQDELVSNKILGKIKNQKVNLGQVFGERHQAVRMVGDNAIRIASALKSLKKGNLSAAAKALSVSPLSRGAVRRVGKFDPRSTTDFVGRAWLEYQYGWKPLLDDVYGAAQAVAELPFQAHYNRVSAQSDKEFTNEAFSSDPIDGGVIVRSGKLTSTRKSKLTIFFTATDSTNRSLTALGITNPAAVAWELLPWSFVIDWFLPIGDFINTWDATNGVSFAQGSRTVSINTKTVYRTESTSLSYGRFSGLRVLEVFKMDRERVISFPSPHLPSFKNPVSTGHALNALALLNALRPR